MWDGSLQERNSFPCLFYTVLVCGLGICTPLRHELVCLVPVPIYNFIIGSGSLIFSRSRWIIPYAVFEVQRVWCRGATSRELGRRLLLPSMPSHALGRVRYELVPCTSTGAKIQNPCGTGRVRGSRMRTAYRLAHRRATNGEENERAQLGEILQSQLDPRPGRGSSPHQASWGSNPCCGARSTM
jgi:hypothetical protein